MNYCKAMFVVAALSFSALVVAGEPQSQPSNVAINGYVLTRAELANLERQLGSQVMPGAYLYNTYNGCWLNTSNGARGCLGAAGKTNPGIYNSRYGSGERNANGDWSHYSNAAGGGVGGTGDGCVYAFGWSNC